MSVIDPGLRKIIEGAIEMGFTDIGDGNLQCSEEQLVALCAIVAQQTVKQMEEQLRRGFDS